MAIYLSCSLSLAQSKAVEPVTIGWIGSMTGPQQKWAAYEAAQIALEEINRQGGINGRPLRIIWEDGKGSGTAAAAAAQKLINVDHVKYILGGHCTPESLAIAPIAERAGVVMRSPQNTLHARGQHPSISKYQ